MILHVLFLAAYVSVYSTTGASSVGTPVPITVYYESLCPSSVRFIINKLVPTYNERRYNFADLLANLKLVPYGHVTKIDASKYNYTCQHGKPECDGNKLHGCAVKYVTDMRILLDYIACLMITSQFSKNPYPANECKERVPSHLIGTILTCYETNEGWDEFNSHGNATDSMFGSSRFFVPYVSFNGTRDDDLSGTTKGDFRKMLCFKNGIKNQACTDYS